MEFPSKVKVGHLYYEVRAMEDHEPRASGAWGKTSMLHLRIELDTSLPLPHQANTLLHEIMHAVWRTLEFDFIEAQQNLQEKEEAYVSAMSSALSMVMHDNPNVFDWVRHALKGE